LCYYRSLDLVTTSTINHCHKPQQLAFTVRLAWRSVTSRSMTFHDQHLSRAFSVSKLQDHGRPRLRPTQVSGCTHGTDDLVKSWTHVDPSPCWTCADQGNFLHLLVLYFFLNSVRSMACPLSWNIFLHITSRNWSRTSTADERDPSCADCWWTAGPLGHNERLTAPWTDDWLHRPLPTTCCMHPHAAGKKNVAHIDGGFKCFSIINDYENVGAITYSESSPSQIRAHPSRPIPSTRQIRFGLSQLQIRWP
jgi:hypothetical protein